MCHYLTLKYYMERGLILDRVHRAISFKQRRWLKPYIELNQDKRAAAKSDFEKNFCKLMNNSVYGKTCENQKRRSDVRLVTCDSKLKKLTEKPHLKRFSIFGKDLAAVELQKVLARIDKPFYVGFTVLELSKLHMYRFHYDFIKAKYEDQAELLFTDTDSLYYEIKTDDVYKDFFEHKDLFDFASYSKSSPYYDPTNNKVLISNLFIE